MAGASWLDETPLPFGVIRDGLFIHVNAALAELLGVAPSELVGHPFFERVAPEHQERVRERHMRRLRGESVPESYMFDVVRKDGTHRNVEIWVTTAPTGDVIFQLADRTHMATRRAHLRELAGLGAAVQREHTADRIFATLGRGLVELGLAWTRLAPEGDDLVVLDLGSPSFKKNSNTKMRGQHGTWREATRAAWANGDAFLDDMPSSTAKFFQSTEVATRAGAHLRESNMTRGLILRIDVQRQPWQLLCVLADWLLEEDIGSFGLLRIQVSAALDAARVIADLSARNEQLAVLNQIGAKVGSAGDFAELFSSSTLILGRVLGAKAFGMFLVEGSEAELVQHTGLAASVAIEQRQLRLSDPTSHVGEVVRRSAPMMFQRATRPHSPFEVTISVPLVAGAKVIGVLDTHYDDTAAVRTSHMELLQAVGAHFASAIQAKRLLDDLRKSYVDLARAQEQLVQRERLAALGELAAVVAHEIRNPLGVVFNAVGAIRQHMNGDARLATLVDILAEEATRMNEIVGDLLDFARPVSPALRPERVEPIVVEAVDAAVLDATGPIEVERQIAPSLPAVPIDPRLLRQAILNVAINAVQALGDRGGRIVLRLTAASNGVQIEIADSGPGIATEVQPRIFEPFFTTRPSGTGLGLTVVKRIVDVHRGETSLESSKDGTRFVIRLPHAG